MQSDPIGGFPPIVRVEEGKISEKTLESRGFSTTNIVSINNIMDLKKKENLFVAFGTEDEDGVDYAIEGMFTENPYDYKKIKYKEIPIKLKRNDQK